MTVIRKYLHDIDTKNQKELLRLYTVIKKIVPTAEESTSYGIPTVKYKKRPLIGFSANKHHLSIYPFSPKVIATLKKKLTGFELSKGTIRFTPDNQIPISVLKKILKLRIAEIDNAIKQET